MAEIFNLTADCACKRIKALREFKKWFLGNPNVKPHSLREKLPDYINRASFILYCNFLRTGDFEVCETQWKMKEVILMQRCLNLASEIDHSTRSVTLTKTGTNRSFLPDTNAFPKIVRAIIETGNYVLFGSSITRSFMNDPSIWYTSIYEFVMLGFQYSERDAALKSLKDMLRTLSKTFPMSMFCYNGNILMFAVGKDWMIFHLTLPTRRCQDYNQNALISMISLNGPLSDKNIGIFLKSKVGDNVSYSFTCTKRTAVWIGDNSMPTPSVSTDDIMGIIVGSGPMSHLQNPNGDHEKKPYMTTFQTLDDLFGYFDSSPDEKLSKSRSEADAKHASFINTFENNTREFIDDVTRAKMLNAMNFSGDMLTSENIRESRDVFIESDRLELQKKIFIPFELFRDLQWLFTEGQYRMFGRRLFMDLMLPYFTVAWASDCIEKLVLKAKHDYDGNVQFYNGVVKLCFTIPPVGDEPLENYENFKIATMEEDIKIVTVVGVGYEYSK